MALCASIPGVRVCAHASTPSVCMCMYVCVIVLHVPAPGVYMYNNSMHSHPRCVCVCVCKCMSWSCTLLPQGVYVTVCAAPGVCVRAPCAPTLGVCTYV